MTSNNIAQQYYSNGTGGYYEVLVNLEEVATTYYPIYVASKDYLNETIIQNVSGLNVAGVVVGWITSSDPGIIDAPYDPNNSVEYIFYPETHIVYNDIQYNYYPKYERNSDGNIEYFPLSSITLTRVNIDDQNIVQIFNKNTTNWILSTETNPNGDAPIPITKTVKNYYGNDLIINIGQNTNGIKTYYSTDTILHTENDENNNPIYYYRYPLNQAGTFNTISKNMYGTNFSIWNPDQSSWTNENYIINPNDDSEEDL